MRLFAASFAALIASAALSYTSASRAEDGAPARAEHPVFVGASGGLGFASVEHPGLLASSFTCATLGLHVGYALTQRFSVGLDLTTLETTISRSGGGEDFGVGAAALHPLAGCNNCRPLRPGGSIDSTTVVFGSAGPRVEYAPFGRDGLYVGGSAGVAFITGIDGDGGFGGALRTGYRARLGQLVTLAAEAGFLAQRYGDGSVSMPYGALVLRPYL